MKPNQPKHQHYCHHCNNTETCQYCEGRGCMECNYTGLCRYCQDVTIQADQPQAKQTVTINHNQRGGYTR